MGDFAKLVILLDKFFEGDTDKVLNWIMQPNPLLGNIEPIMMLRLGREEKLLKFVENLTEENSL